MIWCVEDDASIRDIELYALTSTGFEAKGFEDGTSFWNALQEEQPDLVLLDVMLPGTDGVELLKKMKASETFRDIPVIMATAKGTEYDKIESLDLGADDYLVKPFGIMEMVSRIKAVLRRCQKKVPVKLLSVDGLVLSTAEHTVTADGQRIALTGEIRNIDGEFWYETQYMDRQCFVYGEHLEAIEKEYWFTSFWKGSSLAL